MFARFSLTLIVVVMASSSVAFGQAATVAPTPETKEPAKANSRPTPTPQVIAEPFDGADVKTMASKCVKLETEAGDIEIELYPESAPETVRNFLNLAAIGAYDTTVFSRVVPGFIIQGGDLYTRDGKMTYALGMRARKAVPDEPNKILHERGVVSMARTEQPNSATTHFFILVSAGPNLDGSFAAFGRVTKGMEIVDAINKAPVDGEKPVKPVGLKKASIFTCLATPAP